MSTIDQAFVKAYKKKERIHRISNAHVDSHEAKAAALGMSDIWIDLANEQQLRFDQTHAPEPFDQSDHRQPGERPDPQTLVNRKPTVTPSAADSTTTTATPQASDSAVRIDPPQRESQVPSGVTDAKPTDGLAMLNTHMFDAINVAPERFGEPLTEPTKSPTRPKMAEKPAESAAPPKVAEKPFNGKNFILKYPRNPNPEAEASDRGRSSLQSPDPQANPPRPHLRADPPGSTVSYPKGVGRKEVQQPPALKVEQAEASPKTVPLPEAPIAPPKWLPEMQSTVEVPAAKNKDTTPKNEEATAKSEATSAKSGFEASWEVDQVHLPSVVTKLMANGTLLSSAGLPLTDACQAGLKTLLISSPKPAQGRTTLAVGLAASVAKTGLRIALLELAYEQPGLTEQLQLYVELGWPEAIRSNVSLEESAIYSIADRLTLLPIIPSENRVVPSGKEVIQVVNQLRPAFDLVIVDGPPCCDPNQSLIPAGIFDSALIVRDHRNYDHEALKACSRTLRQANIEHLGIADNFVNPSESHDAS